MARSAKTRIERWVFIDVGQWHMYDQPVMKLRDQITIETDLFEHRDVKPHFINPCCFGEDLGIWLGQQLRGLASFDFVQEDYGWGFWASRNGTQFWVALSYAGDGPTDAPAQWILSIDEDYGLNVFRRIFQKRDVRSLQCLRESILEVISSSRSITIVPNPDCDPTC
jgi:hypothetical protein